MHCHNKPDPYMSWVASGVSSATPLLSKQEHNRCNGGQCWVANNTAKECPVLAGHDSVGVCDWPFVSLSCLKRLQSDQTRSRVPGCLLRHLEHCRARSQCRHCDLPLCWVSILAQKRKLDCVATICSVSQDGMKGIIDGHTLHVTQTSHRNLAYVLFFTQSIEVWLFVFSYLVPPSSLCLDLPPLLRSDVEAQSEPFWPVLWRWWRPDCSLHLSLSTSLRSSSVLWMEPAWPVWPHLVLYIVSSKKKKPQIDLLLLRLAKVFICPSINFHFTTLMPLFMQ